MKTPSKRPAISTATIKRAVERARVNPIRYKLPKS